MTKWYIKGIPHKGWSCEDILDLGEDVENTDEIVYEQCEMCGNEKIRYVHIMKHNEYEGMLHVGCVCAEKMSDDYENPRKNEEKLKNKIKRKSNFNKIEWNYNIRKKTYSKKIKGEYITILESKYGNFGIFFANRAIWKYNGKKIETFEKAEKIAFEIFERYHTTQDERKVFYHYND